MPDPLLPLGAAFNGEKVMIVVLGFIAVLAVVVIGVAGVLGNDGSGHALTHGFAVFGFRPAGSTGALFLSGIEVGVIGLAALNLLLTGARRARRSKEHRADQLRHRHDSGRTTAADAVQSAIGPRLPADFLFHQPAEAV